MAFQGGTLRGWLSSVIQLSALNSPEAVQRPTLSTPLVVSSPSATVTSHTSWKYIRISPSRYRLNSKTDSTQTKMDIAQVDECKTNRRVHALVLPTVYAPLPYQVDLQLPTLELANCKDIKKLLPRRKHHITNYAFHKHGSLLQA